MSMSVVPDFGYPEYGSQGGSLLYNNEIFGWKLFYDYVKKEPKFQKLSNFIEERNLVKK